MKKILAFAGSNSSTSINHQLVTFAASQIKDHQVKVIKLTDFELPMFSEDIEKEKGYSSNLELLNKEFETVDGIIISVNEHNGMVSGFYKNTNDWLSRINRDFLKNKKVLVMSSSPGARGASSALAYTTSTLPRFGAEITDSFSFPSFYENFSSEEKKITKASLLDAFDLVLQNFVAQLNE
jgi:NAD(P)H-dependent FMN reductase